MTEREKLEGLADEVLSTVNNLLLGTVESILEMYKELFQMEEVKRLGISQVPITEEMRLRLRFECLCLSLFYASLHSLKYLTEKKLFSKRPNQRLFDLFRGAIWARLIQLGKNNGMGNLREIIITTIKPRPTFGLGKPIDPLSRLEEYSAAFKEKPVSEMERFGKWIGKALDAPNYPLLELIGSSQGITLLQMSDNIMSNAFKDWQT